jgi:hypothetical protein
MTTTTREEPQNQPEPMGSSIEPIGSLVAAVLAFSALFLCGFLWPVFNWIVPGIFVVLASWWGISALVKMKRGELGTKQRPHAVAGLIVAAVTVALGVGMFIALAQERGPIGGGVDGGLGEEDEAIEQTEDLEERWRPIDEP